MKSLKHNRQATQSGFSLIVVLIMLLIMMIMGIALFRSTEVGSLIAGNAAAKQAASQAGNIGLVKAQTIIDGTIPTASGNGYSTTALTLDSYGIPTATTAVAWHPATPTALVANESNGYRYQYIIEKLCTAAGACAKSSASTKIGNSSLAINVKLPDTATTTIDLYRVTVKVQGPRSTLSYVQAIYGK